MIDNSNAHSVIPPAYDKEFTNGINHPQLYLWDAWSYIEDDIMHLYSLAVSRYLNNGSVLEPSNRNNYPFHIRHFVSKDEGLSWKDEGCFLKPRTDLEKFDSRTVWSGSIELLKDGRKLVAYTGLDETDPEHNFLQHIGLAISKDGYEVDELMDHPLSSPKRDYEQIKEQGYYLDLPENLGNSRGEEGGPILAWRDPYIFQHPEGKINLFWAGKVGPLNNAMVWAEIKEIGDSFKMTRLHAPITLPDGDEFTQLELPKIYYDGASKTFYLIISTCNRLYEGQSDAEVDKCIRVYSSLNLDGPWKSLGNKLLGKENLFGVTVLKTDFNNHRMLCIAPYTDAKADGLNLTFSRTFYIYLDGLRVEFL